MNEYIVKPFNVDDEEVVLREWKPKELIRCKNCCKSKIKMRTSSHPMSVGFDRYCTVHKKWVSEVYFCADGEKGNGATGKG